MSSTEFWAQAADYLVLELYLYTRDRFSISRTELRARAAAYHEEPRQEEHHGAGRTVKRP